MSKNFSQLYLYSVIYNKVKVCDLQTYNAAYKRRVLHVTPARDARAADIRTTLRLASISTRTRDGSTNPLVVGEAGTRDEGGVDLYMEVLPSTPQNPETSPTSFYNKTEVAEPPKKTNVVTTEIYDYVNADLGPNKFTNLCVPIKYIYIYIYHCSYNYNMF